MIAVKDLTFTDPSGNSAAVHGLKFDAQQAEVFGS